MGATVLPSDTEQLVGAFRFQLRFYLRTWRFIGLALLVAAITAAFAGLTLDHGTAVVKAASPTAADYLSMALAELGSTVAIVCAFFGGDAIAMDFGSGSGYFALVQPVRRPVLLLGRFLAAAAASFVVLLIYWGTEVLLAAGIYGGLPGTETLESLGFLILSLLAVLSFAFFFSSLFSRPIVAIVVTVLLLIIAFPLVQLGLENVGVEPLFLVTYPTDLVYEVFAPAAHIVHTPIPSRMGGTVGSITTYNPIPWEGATALALLFLGFLIVAIVLHLYKEVKG